MDLVARINTATGILYKHISQYRGGTFKGPCPWCGGDDRFAIYPAQGRYICNQCSQVGDAIQFERDYNGLNYFQACAAVGVEPQVKESIQTTPQPWQPREIKPVPGAWAEKAGSIQFSAYKFLVSAAGRKPRAYLQSRGIMLDTIKAARIGYNPTAAYYDHSDFGLPPATNSDTGKPKRVWIPQGILIPVFLKDTITRIRIRQDNPTGKDRYILVAGSQTAYFFYPSDEIKPISIVVESELDGWLVWQSAGDLVNVFAIGNSTARPDHEADYILSHGKILLALDFDEAGLNESLWWKNQYNVIDWPVPVGKDPGEAYQAGVNIREWVQGGIDACKPKKKIKVDLGPSPQELAAMAKRETIEKPEETIEKPEETIEKPEETIELKEINKSSKTCQDGLFCMDMFQARCLITGRSVFFMHRCPNNRWKVWIDPESDGAISCVIKLPWLRPKKTPCKKK